jgi:class 3 adenylate cyclase
MWGETVNLASRLESHGTPGKIAVSHEIYCRLRHAFEFSDCQHIDIKGSGPAKTYFLHGRRASRDESSVGTAPPIEENLITTAGLPAKAP